MRCVNEAWEKHESELRRFLRHRASNDAEAEDLLQEIFLRALRQTNGLCSIDNSRAWLFHAARNLLIDRLRLTKDQVPLPDDLVAPSETALAAVDGLAQCLPRVLAELSAQDREAITLCDLEGMAQQDYAHRKGLTVSGGVNPHKFGGDGWRRKLASTLLGRGNETGAARAPGDVQ